MSLETMCADLAVCLRCRPLRQYPNLLPYLHPVYTLLPANSPFHAEWWEMSGSRYISFENRFHDVPRPGKIRATGVNQRKHVKREFLANVSPSVAGKGK